MKKSLLAILLLTAVAAPATAIGPAVYEPPAVNDSPEAVGDSPAVKAETKLPVKKGITYTEIRNRVDAGESVSFSVGVEPVAGSTPTIGYPAGMKPGHYRAWKDAVDGPMMQYQEPKSVVPLEGRPPYSALPNLRYYVSGGSFAPNCVGNT